MNNKVRKYNRLYVHVPFCASKCAYCAFYSISGAEDDSVSAYFARLSDEFTEYSANCAELKSVFIGGGTPSYLSAANLAKLFNLISANFAIAEDAEISIECNPESLSDEKCAVIAEFANRVSLGVQSFNCEFRRILGRQGDVNSFFKASELFRGYGLKNIGCDLIYSIPGQSCDDWLCELRKAGDAGVTHVSAYSLTYEEGTSLTEEFAGSVNNEEQADIEADMWEMAGVVIKEFGLQRYEISNYALPGYECKHNLDIWFGDTYLGCGPAAVSFDGFVRYSNPSSLSDWLQTNERNADLISPEARASEILAMGLRTSHGWDVDLFEKRTGFSIETWSDNLKEAENFGLVDFSGQKIIPKEQGLLLWDELAMILLMS